VQAIDIIMFERINSKRKSQLVAAMFLTLIVGYKAHMHSWFCSKWSEWKL